MARDANKFSGSQSSVKDFKRDCEWGTDWKKNQLAHVTKVWIGIRPRRGAGDGRGEKSRGVGRVGMIIEEDNFIACPTNLTHSITQLQKIYLTYATLYEVFVILLKLPFDVERITLGRTLEWNIVPFFNCWVQNLHWLVKPRFYCWKSDKDKTGRFIIILCLSTLYGRALKDPKGN